MNIIKKFGTTKPFIASILIACILILYNIPLLIATPSGNLLMDIVALAILTIVTSLVIYILSINTILVRIVTIPLALISSVFLYFILFYKIKIYPPIMTAIFETETTEALELLSVNLVLWIGVFGLIPSYIIIKLTKNIGSSKRNRIIFISLLLIFGVFLKFDIGTTYTTLKPIAKNFNRVYPALHPSYVFNKHLPFSYIYNTKLHISRSLNYITQKKKDITAKYQFSLENKKNNDVFFVLVIGESARADRFSLNGYKRNTNPLLAGQKNLISYKDFHSLGTSTMEAVPHIFVRDLKSKTRDEVKETSFIHILNSLGFKSFWLSCWRSRMDSLIYDIALESNVTAYAPHIETYNSNNTDPDSLLYDQALLEPLKQTLEGNKNGLIVLHTRGSHIAYYNRTPEKFRIYSPACSDHCLSDPRALSNSYDNTILYTDFFLNEVINSLKDKNAIFLYLSDHGESLGENGIFSHAAAFETAPKEQTHIPMIWWASDKFLSSQENSEKFTQIKNNLNKFVDQSYVFHSVLDCMGVKSNAIDKNKSLCNRQLRN
jgi:glucan phosphoethanolaminetransferase (alkaline phosphatase superfamily)